jgi:hypothetical protein
MEHLLRHLLHLLDQLAEYDDRREDIEDMAGVAVGGVQADSH